MLLPFSQQLNGKPTLFVEKIIKCWEEQNLKPRNVTELLKVYPYDRNKVVGVTSKKHTIREDKKSRWASGKLIHPVINNRTKNMFQFLD